MSEFDYELFAIRYATREARRAAGGMANPWINAIFPRRSLRAKSCSVPVPISTTSPRVPPGGEAREKEWVMQFSARLPHRTLDAPGRLI